MDSEFDDHAVNPRNVGAFPEGTPGMTKALTNEPACGDVLKLQLIVSPEGVVTEARFKTFGCGTLVAATSWLTVWAIGKHVRELVDAQQLALAHRFALPSVKLHCPGFAERVFAELAARIIRERGLAD